MSNNPLDNMSDAELQTTYEEHLEDQPETTFDQETLELMKLIKEKVPEHCNAVIILKPHDANNPIVFTQGHPYEVAVLGAQFTRTMKNQILPDLET